MEISIKNFEEKIDRNGIRFSQVGTVSQKFVKKHAHF